MDRRPGPGQGPRLRADPRLVPVQARSALIRRSRAGRCSSARRAGTSCRPGSGRHRDGEPILPRPPRDAPGAGSGARPRSLSGGRPACRLCHAPARIVGRRVGPTGAAGSAARSPAPPSCSVMRGGGAGSAAPIVGDAVGRGYGWFLSGGRPRGAPGRRQRARPRRGAGTGSAPGLSRPRRCRGR